MINAVALFALILPVTMMLTLVLIQFKHLLIDWIFQPPYEHQNKGTYLHFGGIRHAGKNAIGTGLCFAIGFLGNLSWPIVLGVVIADFLIHYHIDYAKEQIKKAYALDPQKHPQFWWLLGLDQALHQLTYLLLIIGVVLILIL